MYIRQIQIKNFSLHLDAKVRLAPITVFVGPNGGGKSALFEALLNFSMISRGNIRQAFNRYPFSYEATVHRGAVHPARISFRVELCESADSPNSLSYYIQYSQTEPNEDYPNFTIQNETLTEMPGNNVLFDRADPPKEFHGLLENDRSLFAAIRFASTIRAKLQLPSSIVHCAQYISKFNRFRLEPTVLALPSRLPDIDDTDRSFAPRIGYSGEDLPGTLYYLNQKSAPEYEIIKARIREIEPLFKDFEFNLIGADRVGFSAIFSDNRQAIAAPRLSSGLLTYIGLIVLASSPKRPAIMMIEEPENGLTPQAIRSFYTCLRSLANQASQETRSQIMISSHSPFVICEAWNGDDRDFIHQVKVHNGHSLIRKFSDVILEQKIHLAKDGEGNRTGLGLKIAEEVMSGRFS
jgi:predicted ATPase